MSETILMSCEYFFSPPKAAGKKINKKGRSFIPSYSTTNPEFANSKRLPKVSSLVRDKREPTKDMKRLWRRGGMFLSLPLLTFHIFFYSRFYLNATYIYIYLLLKNIARNVCCPLHVAGTVLSDCLFFFSLCEF